MLDDREARCKCQTRARHASLSRPHRGVARDAESYCAADPCCSQEGNAGEMRDSFSSVLRGSSSIFSGFSRS
jgi:hypothetical protein